MHKLVAGRACTRKPPGKLRLKPAVLQAIAQQAAVAQNRRAPKAFSAICEL